MKRVYNFKVALLILLVIASFLEWPYFSFSTNKNYLREFDKHLKIYKIKHPNDVQSLESLDNNFGDSYTNYSTPEQNLHILDEILNISRISYSVPVFRHIPSNDKFKVKPGQCPSCALVLSSGYLLKVEAGPSIDAHDCVFRFNFAPVKGYERFVGSKTTVRLLAHSKKFRLLLPILEQESPKVNHSLIFFYPPNQEKPTEKMAKHFASIFRHTSLRFYLGETGNVAYFQRYFSAQTGRKLGQKHVWMTTGFVGVVIGLKICDSITIFGAVSKQHCDSGLVSEKMPYNYYGQKNDKLCTTMKSKPYGHQFFDEHLIYEKWAKRRKITLMFPEKQKKSKASKTKVS